MAWGDAPSDRVVDTTTWGNTITRSWPPAGVSRPFAEDTIAGQNGVEIARAQWSVPTTWTGQFVISTTNFDLGAGDTLEVLVGVVLGCGRAQADLIVAGGFIPLNQDFAPLPPILALNVAETISVRVAWRVTLGPVLVPVPRPTMTIYAAVAPFAPAIVGAGRA